MDNTGRQPGLDRGFGLEICTSCRAGHHANCRPFRRHRRLLYCECPGWRKARGQLIALPCLTPHEETRDAR